MLLSFQLTSDVVQVALVHNPSEPSNSPPLVATAVQALLSNLSPNKAWRIVSGLLDSEGPLDQQAVLSLTSEAGVAETKMKELLTDEAVFKLIKDHSIFCHQVLKLEPGQTALLSNGRVGLS